MRRLFVGVPLDEEVRAMLAQHLDPNQLPGKPVRPESWHLTLRFLGPTDELTEDKVTAALDQVDLGKAFDIELGPMGAFPRSSRASVLWLGLTRGIERLSELHEVCEVVAESVGLERESRPYASHLTLSRIRPEDDVRPVIESYEPMPFRWKASEAVLFESHLASAGAVYEPVERFPLR